MARPRCEKDVKLVQRGVRRDSPKVKRRAEVRLDRKFQKGEREKKAPVSAQDAEKQQPYPEGHAKAENERPEEWKA